MNCRVLIFTTLALSGSGCAGSAPDVGRFLQDPPIGSVDFSEDATLFVQRADLYLKPRGTPAEKVETGYRVVFARFLSNGRDLVFSTGEGSVQFRSSDGRIERLLPPSSHGTRWARLTDEDRLFIWRKRPSIRAWVLLELDLEARSSPREHATISKQDFKMGAWVDATGRWLLTRDVLSNRHHELHIRSLDDIEASSRALDLRVGIKRPVHFDNAQIVYASDVEGEHTALYRARLDPAPLAPERVSAFRSEGAVIGYARDRTRAWEVIERRTRGIERVELHGPSGHQTLPQLQEGRVLHAHFHVGDLCLKVGSDRRPAVHYRYSLADGALEKIADAATLPPADMIPGREIEFTSWDGREIPAVLYRPRGASAGAPVRAIVHLHGGPSRQARRTYQPDLQFLLSRGFAILDVDYRGSSGYGKTFESLNDHDHGRGDLRDVIAARRHLDDVDWIDASRVAVMGGSYGGFLTAAALAFYPNEFAAGVDLFGVTSWKRLLEKDAAAGWRGYIESEYGTAEEAADRWRSVSPAQNSTGIRAPLLIVQGGRDQRVPTAQGVDLSQRIIASGRPVEYIYLPHDGHGFRSRSSWVRGMTAIEDFIRRNLR